jgi:hypothetical protein
VFDISRDTDADRNDPPKVKPTATNWCSAKTPDSISQLLSQWPSIVRRDMHIHTTTDLDSANAMSSELMIVLIRRNE